MSVILGGLGFYFGNENGAKLNYCFSEQYTNNQNGVY